MSCEFKRRSVGKRRRSMDFLLSIMLLLKQHGDKRSE